MDRRRLAGLCATLGTVLAELATALLEDEPTGAPAPKPRPAPKRPRRKPTYRPKAAAEATDLDVERAKRALSARGIVIG
jgi:hypothetical protein